MQSTMAWPRLFERTGRSLRRSDIRDLLAVTARPDIINFGGGLPAPELFPVEELRRAFNQVLIADGPAALQYGLTEGHRPLRELIAQRAGRRGISCSPDDVMITTGSQQALDLLGEVFLSPEMKVLIEGPSYVGALQAFAAQQARFIPFPMDEEGLVVPAVTRWLDHERTGSRPDQTAFLYTVATFQNPSGVSMSLPRRLELISLSHSFGLPIVEDDPYSELCYGSQAPPAIRANAGGEDVIYLGTFSKILSPGLRLGYVIAPGQVIERLVVAKQGRDLHTDGLSQRAVVEYCRHHDIDEHIERLRAAYGERRNAMLAALKNSMSEVAEWTEPQGGMFLWVTLDPSIDTTELLSEGLEQRVAYVPGSAFHIDGSGRNCMRLNFTNSTGDQIQEGIARLGGLIKTRVHEARRATATAIVR